MRATVGLTLAFMLVSLGVIALATEKPQAVRPPCPDAAPVPTLRDGEAPVSAP